MTQSHTDPDHLSRLINETEAAEFLGYTIRALQNWRLRGGGPQFIKVSRRSIRYRRRDLIAWADDRVCSSTSEDAVSPRPVRAGSRPLTGTRLQARRAESGRSAS
jgi:predicted DNA-binding transcriptional regulator AlpA